MTATRVSARSGTRGIGRAARWALPEAAITGVGAVRLARRGRWRAAVVVVVSFAGARLSGPLSSEDRSGPTVGAAYGFGRIAPAWRIPLLAASAIVHAGRARSANRRVVTSVQPWLFGLAGAMTAAGAAERLLDRWPRQTLRRRVAIVVNTNSGSPHLARRAVRALHRLPLDIIETERTSGSGMAQAIQRALTSLPPDGVLVVAGGDGTVGLAATRSADADRILAILPTGTGNDIARSIRLPLNPEEAAAVVAEGEVARMDLGFTDSGSFAHAATVGMTAEFARRVRDVQGWRRPMLYLIKAWQAWKTREGLAATVVVDGRPITTPAPPFQIAVVNAPRLGGRVGVTLPTAVDDGLFEVVVAHAKALSEAAKSVTGLLRTQSGRPLPGATVRSGRVVEIHSPTPLLVSLDGEPSGVTPFKAYVRPAACRVIRPRAQMRPER